MHVFSFTGTRNEVQKCYQSTQEHWIEASIVSHTNDPAELFAGLQVNCGEVAGSGSSMSQSTLLCVFWRLGVGKV